MPTITIEPSKPVGHEALPPDMTYVLVEGHKGIYGDHFPDRKAGKKWATDVLVAYFGLDSSAASALVDEAACDCDGATHRTTCWWCVNHDDGRDQAT